MSTSSSLTITNASLLKVCRELLDYRTYKSSLISIEGEPSITPNGICSDISDVNYCYRRNLAFQSADENPVTVSFNGVFLTSTNEQYAWVLSGNGVNNLSLSFTNSQAIIKIGSIELTSINVSPKDGDSISARFKFTPTEYEFSVIHNDRITTETGSISTNIALQTAFTNVILGKNPEETDKYWNGKINLPNFIISNKQEIIYSPSISTSFNFTKILVGDGVFPLSDSSIPVINHIYESPIINTYGSGNTLYIIADIGADAHLNIQEIALYYKGEDSDKEEIFCVARDVNIYKGADLDYDLILTVDLSINIANIVGFPDTGDIIVVEPEYAKYQDFQHVQQAITYVNTNLERIIYQNAQLIGTDKVFPYYRNQRAIDTLEENYNTTRIYQKLDHKIVVRQDNILDLEKVRAHGNISTPDNGVLTGFSASDYVTSNLNLYDFDTFSYINSFKRSELNGTVTCLSNNNEYQPVTIFTENGKCGVKIAQREKLVATLLDDTLTFYRYPLSDLHIPIGSSAQYKYCCAWHNDDDGINLYNAHLYNDGMILTSNNLEITTFLDPTLWAAQNSEDTENENFLEFDVDPWSMESYELTNSRVLNTDPHNWYFVLPFTLYENANPIRYILGNSYLGCSIQLYVENYKLKMNAYENGDLNSPIFEGFATDYTVEENVSYIAEVGFDGSQYFLRLSDDTGLVYSESYSSQKEVSWEGGLALGSNYDEINGYEYLLMGSVNLENFKWYSNGLFIWKGSSDLSTLYTSTNKPNTESAVYDDSGIRAPSSVISFTNGYILNENNLFPMNPDTEYFLKISCAYENDEYKYTIFNSSDGIQYNQILEQTSPYRISTPITNYFGVEPTYTYNSNYDLTISTTNPLSGTIYSLNSELAADSNQIWNVYKTITTNDTNLLQYYHVADINRALYGISDFENFNYKLDFVRNTFRGNEDLINFNNPKGFTMSVKVDLQDMNDKVLLVKRNNSGGRYFTLTLEDYKLIFNIYLRGSVLTLEHSIPVEEYRNFTGNPVLITVVVKGLTIQMYRNNELIAQSDNFIYSSLDASKFYLSNSLYNDHRTPTRATEEDNPVDGLDIEPTQIYVKDIVVIEGALGTSDLYYMNNLLDTNF